MDRIKAIVKDLERTLSNLEKAPNRKYKAETLDSKEQTVQDSLAILKQLETEEKSSEFVAQADHTKTLSRQIIELIRGKRELSKDIMPFDIKTATALLPHYTGKEDETESFIEAVDLLYEITAEDDRDLMVKFIKTRISGKARLALPENIDSVDAIKDKLRQKFLLKISSDAILAQLRSTHQGNKKLSEYIAQVESLASQLTRAFIAENVASGEAAEKLAEKFAKQSFIDNVANQETSIILKASNLTKLSDLAAKAISIDKPAKANILHYKNNSQKQQYNNWHPNNQKKPNSNWHSNNQNKPNFNNNNGYNHQNFTPRYNDGTQSYNNFPNKFNQQPFNRNNFGNTRYQQNTNRYNQQIFDSGNPSSSEYHQNMTPTHPNPTRQRVYCCNSGESQSPQQDAQPSQLGGAELIGESTT